jgi:hypothetical protein
MLRQAGRPSDLWFDVINERDIRRIMRYSHSRYDRHLGMVRCHASDSKRGMVPASEERDDAL